MELFINNIKGQLGSVKLLDKRAHADPESAISTIITPLHSSLPMIDFEIVSLSHPEVVAEKGWDNSVCISSLLFILFIYYLFIYYFCLYFCLYFFIFVYTALFFLIYYLT
jgi:hypothetical protein